MTEDEKHRLIDLYLNYYRKTKQREVTETERDAVVSFCNTIEASTDRFDYKFFYKTAQATLKLWEQEIEDERKLN